MTIDQSLRQDLLKSTGGPSYAKKSGDGNPPTGADLDQHLVSSSKQVLLKKIDFQPAERDVSFQLQNLRVKYVPLNPAKSGGAEGDSKSSKQGSLTSQALANKMPGDGIPAPKRILSNPNVITLNWQKCHRIGAGLINMGNTCFLNSVLQCLTYTPPLVNYLLSHHHKDECRELGFCMMCALQTHIQRSYQHNQPAIRPMVILNKLKHIAKHMHQGRQEDAHEFLRMLIEAMQKSCISGMEKTLDRLSKETTIVYNIFGGYYRSRVTCAVCQGKSDTYDPFLDIGLDIKHAPSVYKAFERLIRPETLDGENMYQCKKCNRKVQAQKRFTIHRAPKILTLCLKRFDFNRFSMGKIHKDVGYTEHINLRPFMSDNKGASVVYQLYGVLKHEGASCNSGHYYCYVKGANQSWYCMNDSYVSQCGLNRVLNQNAYLLFYVLKESKPTVNGTMRGQDSKSSIKQHPATNSTPANPHNGPLGTAVSRQFIGPVKPKIIADKPIQKNIITTTVPAKHNHLPAAVPLPDQRAKLTFQIRRPGQPVQTTGSKLVKPGVPSATSAAGQSPAVKTPVVQSPVVKSKDPVPSSKPAIVPSKPPVATSTPSKTNLQGLVKLKSVNVATPSKTNLKEPVKLKASVNVATPAKANVATPPKTNVATPAKTGFMGLVPYSAEDSNSSDSENYDAVAEQLSQLPKGSSEKKASVEKKEPTQNGSVEKKEPAQNGNVVKQKSETERKLDDSSDMKPPTQILSHADISNGASRKRSQSQSLANGTDLTVLRKPDSPLKLTITTNGNAQRLKATGHWRVSDIESQVSPSPASDSSIHSNHSNVSTNSTSEWAVQEKREAPSTPQKVKEEAASYGWNITPSRMEMMRSFSDPGTDKQQSWKPNLERKTIKEAEDMQGNNVRTSDWLHNRHISHQSDTLFGFNVTSVNESSVPRNLSEVFDKKEENQKPIENASSSTLFSRDVKGNGEKKEENEESVSRKKRKHKKQKQDVEQLELTNMKCEVNVGSEKAKSPDVGEGDSGYYSIKSKNHNSDEEDEEEEEDESLRKPKKHKHKKKKKKRSTDQDDDDNERTKSVPNESEVYGPVLPDSIKEAQRTHTDDYRHSKSYEDRHKSHEHKVFSPDHNHKQSRSESDQRIKSPDQKHRHKSNDHRYRSPDQDDRSHKSSIHGQDHKNRHKSNDRHEVRSPDHDRRLKSPSYDRVRSPDYEHRNKKHGGDSENSKHRTNDRHRHSSDESDRHRKYSENRTSGDEDHSYAKTSKDKKRKRKHRDRDEYSDREKRDDKRDEYSDREKGYDKRDDYREDYRKDKDVDRFGSPNKKHKSVNGDSWESDSKGYGDERRKADESRSKPKHDAPTQQWDHHIKDGYKRSHDNAASSRLSSSWDGSKRTSSANVVDQLNQSSMHAYGPAVSSWEGGRSGVDEELDRDATNERTRDSYDQEFDRGKVKKVKYRYDDDDNRHNHNPFQSEQNRRNKGHFYQDHYDRHRPHPKKSNSWHSGGPRR